MYSCCFCEFYLRILWSGSSNLRSSSSGMTRRVPRSCNRRTGYCLSPGWLPSLWVSCWYIRMNFEHVLLGGDFDPVRWFFAQAHHRTPMRWVAEPRFHLVCGKNSSCPRHPWRKRMAFGPKIFIVLMAHISGSIYNRPKMWFTPYAGISLIDVIDVYIVDMYSCCICAFYLCILWSG